MGRDYGQYCGLARALDVVGDRWNLLIVRQLLVGPARYRELRAGLAGIATNLLADRLRDLESAGVVERTLADDGGAITYALTPWGAELREPIEGLIRWSTPLMVRGPEGDEFRAEWLLLALPALFAGRASTASVTVGIAVDGDESAMVQVRTTPAGIDVGVPDGRDFDAVLRAEASIVLGLSTGLLTLDDVAEAISCEGNKDALRAIFEAPLVSPS
ncbi:winged helix-turn-helix transcriptional regulator [Mycolicibacterium holsaticum]|jgi:DNA-binding HxlR family transcriptional regulator|uniref:HxlR family transcriptional regulator n=1 Tax=Mycolicibacterium holsaticum TaxID=152142 RepID=A0A1E3RZB8_9MYCO|nr:helix-turn-helix domain-containing protein [Mycolicibacterium holsaticum]MDA4108037.1 HxlR family transcriptional regulator [Mycolicibacterium holsaticum DSM 44478 = JCM 12374]ODQ95199.1 HxlR family transcriptional regulator [Mycolicibacterium holsaticum]QZA14542.1 helix-turn-helix transcriptional regulator [Mycolicibacterium holsaticum DSM 44478 = JCM 12374]UNC08012.1 helix-turn-helix transcriptional regulator [Mycolicibacterium holsaticum DSM 44478 = JCM 12374]